LELLVIWRKILAPPGVHISGEGTKLLVIFLFIFPVTNFFQECS
jgi:hypothetical protein